MCTYSLQCNKVSSPKECKEALDADAELGQRPEEPGVGLGGFNRVGTPATGAGGKRGERESPTAQPQMTQYLNMPN